MVILIPAYEPDNELLDLISNLLLNNSLKIVVVNDGSSEKYDYIFEKIESYGCTLLKHKVNMGKGQALKTGFKYIKNLNITENIVCADCDGQHLAKDILNVSNNISDGSVVLGCRNFKNKMPLRSKLGNILSQKIFRIFLKYDIKDTQTGLRGYPISLIDFLIDVKGDRFEYEIKILSDLVKMKIEIKQVEIKTIYLNRNSKFNPISDSFKVLFSIFK